MIRITVYKLETLPFPVTSYLLIAMLISRVPTAKWGFPGGSLVKNSLANAGDTGEVGLIPESGKLPGERSGNPVFLLGKSGQRSLVGYSPWRCK